LIKSESKAIYKYNVVHLIPVKIDAAVYKYQKISLFPQKYLAAVFQN